MASRSFTTCCTHRGPIVRADDGRWIAFAMMNRPVEALQQSFLRTKATDLASFMQVAAAEGEQLERHHLRGRQGRDRLPPSAVRPDAATTGSIIPSRSTAADPTADWGALHGLSSLPNSINPPNGWVQNTNSWPYRAAGAYSPDSRNFPKYMDMVGPNFREDHALQLLTRSRDWTLERLQAAAYDCFQPGFAELVPALLRAYALLPTADPRRDRLAGPDLRASRLGFPLERGFGSPSRSRPIGARR